MQTKESMVWTQIKYKHLSEVRLDPKTELRLLLAILALGATLLYFGFPPWRVLCVVLLPVLLTVSFWWLARRTPVGEFEKVHHTLSWLVPTMVAVSTVLTGGIQGPFTPFLFISVLTPLGLFEKGHFFLRQLLLLLFLVGAISLFPDSVLGPQLPRTEYILVTTVLAVIALASIASRAKQMVRVARAAFAEIEKMREEKLAESTYQLRRLERVSRNIAHELKNPLAAIKSLVQLTQEKVEGKESERLQVVGEEIERMEAIIKGYLSYSRPIEELRLHSLDLLKLLEDVLNILSGRAETQGVGLALEKTDAFVIGDAERLKEAFINLVGNAIEACDRGDKVKLSIVIEKGQAIVLIHDTGCGMKPETLLRVGHAFFTTRREGTGLGVHLARGILAQHGGELSFESVFGEGTRQWVRLPIDGPGQGKGHYPKDLIEKEKEGKAMDRKEG